MAVRVTGADDTGFVELLKESAYGDGGSNASDPFHWLQGTCTLDDTRESVPRPIISGAAPAAMRQLRKGAGGDMELDLEYEGFGRWLEALLGGYEKLGSTAPIDNLFYYTKLVPTYTIKKYQVGEMQEFRGSKITSARIEYADGEPLKFVPTIVSQRMVAAVAAVNTDDGTGSTPIYHSECLAASFCGYDLLEYLHSVTLSVDNKIADNKYAWGSNGRSEGQRTGHQDVMVSITAYWDDFFHAIATPNTGMYAEYLAGLMTNPVISFKFDNGGTSAARKQLQVYIPNVAPMPTEKRVNEPGAPEVTVNFQALNGTIAQNAITGLNGTVPASAAIDAPIAMLLSNAEDGSAY